MPITINPQDFYNQITESIKRLPREWQETINISGSQVNELQFDNILLKYKQQEAEILLNTSAKLLHQNSFIIQDIADAITPTFETLLNTQIKELNYKPLQITLIGVDNAGEIFKDSILMLSRLSEAVSANLVRDDSEIMSILSTVYKFQMLDNKILSLNETLLSLQKAAPKNESKINSIYKQLNTYDKEKNQILLNGINQFSSLIKKYNSQDLLFQDLSEFFEKHHSSIDLILKNAMSQEGILTEYLDINSKQIIAIVRDNNERLLNIGNHYIQGNYIRAILNAIPLLKDSNVRDILRQAFKNFININIFSLFRSSSKINHEVQTNLQAILHESRQSTPSFDPNVLHPDNTHKFMDKKIPITERLIKRAAEIEKSANVLNYDTKKLIYTLRSRNLSSQTLPNIDFSNADIKGFNFSDSTLNNISFQNSTILNTSFKHVNFTGAPNFHGATI
ncbi:hypothetical protein NOVO_04000 [Rickettsiales bacterium Ac37b]|nr:hypothetical protein NOVO_04000 [Rickettsiales bacterium Ac37b]